MKSIYDIRRFNAQLLSEYCGNMASFSERIGRAQTQVSRLMGKNPTRNIGDKLARHIERCFCLPAYWLDRQHHHDIESLNSSLQNFLLNENKFKDLNIIMEVIRGAIDAGKVDEVVFTQLEEIAKKLE
ncbi:hypothetical protein CYQ88_05595 [Hydrogenovibrio sp. SC-1]|uniref:hypothetical protein n=1 Tax=Hydrogenovibrio sp. SC-1 TaxID=2065820 RepID=UPI000C79C844|nr:hypothetical protein [Hydrogenovibrio sp. SC-1]PLA74554.1 hypothetical protein CYQ88_05595 [Hydrogenovibrio sp. SC-1]